MPPALRSIDHVHVLVTDRAAARTWYAKVLGMTPIAALEFWASDGGPLTISDAGDTVHLALFESAATKCRSTIAFGVGATEFMAWKLHLSETLDRPPTLEDHRVSWSLYFSDPDGNPYEVTTYEYDAVSQLQRTGA